MASDTVLRVASLKKRFGGVTALDGLDIELRTGEILGILGPNGSGKTTLVNCVSGVISPTSGDVELEGRIITRWSRERRAKNGLIRTYQNLRLFSDMTVSENIAVGLLGTQGREARRRLHSLVSEGVESHGLGNLARLAVKDLSYGDQRRVEIARAMISTPKVLLLDEPAAGLGEADTDRLAQAIQTARSTTGCGVILIDHDVRFVAGVSDRIAVMNKGQLVRAGTPKEIQEDPLVAQIYLGTTEEGEAGELRHGAEEVQAQ